MPFAGLFGVGYDMDFVFHYIYGCFYYINKYSFFLSYSSRLMYIMQFPTGLLIIF